MAALWNPSLPCPLGRWGAVGLFSSPCDGFVQALSGAVCFPFLEATSSKKPLGGGHRY